MAGPSGAGLMPGPGWGKMCRKPQEAVACRPLPDLCPRALIRAEQGQRGHGDSPELVSGARQGPAAFVSPFVPLSQSRGLHKVTPRDLNMS